MRLDDLHLWFLANPAAPRYVGALKLVAAGKGVSLHCGPDWLASVNWGQIPIKWPSPCRSDAPVAKSLAGNWGQKMGSDPN